MQVQHNTVEVRRIADGMVGQPEGKRDVIDVQIFHYRNVPMSWGCV